MAIPQKETTKYSATVVIATFGRLKQATTLAERIKTLHKNRIQIILIDQTVDPQPMKLDSEIEYFSLTTPNLSEARNLGIKHAAADIVIFLDDDVEITDHTILEHIKAYTDNAVVGAGGRVINDDDRLPPDTAVNTGRTNALKTKFSMNFWSTKKQEIEFPYGCNMSFRKSVLERMSGFDTSFPPPLCAFEEIDAALRAKKYGKIVFLPDALVYHHKAAGGGTRTDEKQKMKLYYLSYGYFLSNHVLFPLSLISLGIRIRTVLKEARYSFADLLHGYFKIR